MQIFKDKTFVTGIIYPDDERDYIIIPDNSEDAQKVIAGWNFEIDWIKNKVKNLTKGDKALVKEAKNDFEKEIKAISKKNHQDLTDEDLKKAVSYLLNKL